MAHTFLKLEVISIYFLVNYLIPLSFNLAFSGVFLFSVIQWKGVVYGDYKYPVWAEFCGWVLALASMLWIPGVALFKIFKTPGDSLYQRVCFLLRPDEEEMKAIEQREGLISGSETQNL